MGPALEGVVSNGHAPPSSSSPRKEREALVTGGARLEGEASIAALPPTPDHALNGGMAAGATRAPSLVAAACQTEDGARSAAGEQGEPIDASADALIGQLRAQLVHTRSRCRQLETRLDGEGAVLLAKFRGHKARLEAAVARGDALQGHRDRVRETLLARLDRLRVDCAVRLSWSAWHAAWSQARAKRAVIAVREANEEAERAMTAAQAAEALTVSALRVSSGASPRPAEQDARNGGGGGGGGEEEDGERGEEDESDESEDVEPITMPEPVGRRQLYRMSYEALVDRVLALQQAVYDAAGAEMPEIDNSPPTPPKLVTVTPSRASSAERRRRSEASPRAARPGSSGGSSGGAKPRRGPRAARASEDAVAHEV